MEHQTYLLLGSNQADRKEQLDRASKSLEEQVGTVVRASAIYETAPWGLSDQRPFYNQVVVCVTPLSPHSLLRQILSIEETMGRKRTKKWGERLIDIDILYYDRVVIEEEDLVIPHPHLAERRFTLVPLVELSPQLEHPVLKKTQEELLALCPDTLAVHKLNLG